MEPLSQERLKGATGIAIDHLKNSLSIAEILGNKTAIAQTDQLKVILSEIIRLQAIEIQQKKVIEFCTTNLTAYGLKSIANEAIQISEGVDIHE